jgi:hypothetical protein
LFAFYEIIFFIFLNVLVLSNIASFIACLKACENRPLCILNRFFVFSRYFVDIFERQKKGKFTVGHLNMAILET